jgi:hypothetical protein
MVIVRSEFMGLAAGWYLLLFKSEVLFLKGSRGGRRPSCCHHHGCLWCHCRGHHRRFIIQ